MKANSKTAWTSSRHSRSAPSSPPTRRRGRRPAQTLLESGDLHEQDLPFEEETARAESSSEESVAEEDAGHTGSAEDADLDTTSGPDDALGLYLRQMGAIPLLNRTEELALARRLETTRQRYRRAALSTWLTLGRVVETFERVQAGKLA